MGIDTRSLSDKVYDYLSEQIIEGIIQYGEQLNIKELAARLGISTMPVREAIKRMQMEGIIKINPRSNCSVVIPTKKSILNAFEMRELIELHSIEKVYARVTGRDLETLQSIVEKMSPLASGKMEPEDLRRYIKLDYFFHSELCVLADNSYLCKFNREINLHLNMSYTYGIGRPPDITGTYEDHRNLLDKLSHNSAEAVEILTRHLKRSWDNISKGEGFQNLS